MSNMSYDEFSDKLRKMKIEYKAEFGKELSTLLELELFLDRKLKRPKSKTIKSLRGLSF